MRKDGGRWLSQEDTEHVEQENMSCLSYDEKKGKGRMRKDELYELGEERRKKQDMEGCRFCELE